jgi:multidrug efflux pump subunit AcrB
MLALKLEKLQHETSIKKKQDQLLKLELDQKRGDLISLTQVAETNIEIATKVKARAKALTVSLPPQLEGLSVRDMAKKIDESIHQMLTDLYEELKITDEQ